MTAEKDFRRQIQQNNCGIVLANEGCTLIIYLKTIPFFIKKFYVQNLMVISNLIVLLVDVFPSVEF